MTIDTTFEKEDWVSGKTSEGAMFQGWVECVKANGADIYIANSDDANLIGLTSRFRFSQMKKVEDNLLIDEGAILNLIDIALDEHNKEEFVELTKKLQMLKGKVGVLA
ncbi:MAG: hypothetical protein K0R18_365 [Bacillales bacterium]|jgi:hypothetical protein|nr:hypothetical protein [Bacillales bacterium]